MFTTHIKKHSGEQVFSHGHGSNQDKIAVDGAKWRQRNAKKTPRNKNGFPIILLKPSLGTEIDYALKLVDACCVTFGNQHLIKSYYQTLPANRRKLSTQNRYADRICIFLPQRYKSATVMFVKLYTTLTTTVGCGVAAAD